MVQAVTTTNALLTPQPTRPIIHNASDATIAT